MVHLNDLMIRSALKEELTQKMAQGSRLIEELTCCRGAIRIDMAVISNSFAGYEIKSDRDNFSRFSMQSLGYNRVFGEMTLVTTEKYLDFSIKKIPEWWGLWIATSEKNNLWFKKSRLAYKNPSLQPFEIASLLWKNEALELLKSAGIDMNSRATRYDLWMAIANILPICELSKAVAKKIKARGDWKADSRRKLNGGLSQPSAKSPGCRVKLARSRNPVYIGHPS